LCLSIFDIASHSVKSPNILPIDSIGQHTLLLEIFFATMNKGRGVFSSWFSKQKPIFLTDVEGNKTYGNHDYHERHR